MLRGLHYRLLVWTVVSATVVFLSGCGEDKSREITAANSQYAPAAPGDDATPDAAPEAPGPTFRQAPDLAPLENERDIPPGTSSSGRSPKSPSGAQKTPPPRGIAQDNANAAATGKAASSNNPADLLAQLEKLDEQFNEYLRVSDSVDSVRPQLERNLAAQRAAADKLLAVIDEDNRFDAVSMKVRALNYSLQLQIPNAEKDLRAFVETLEGDKDPDIARIAAQYRLEIPLIQLQTGQIDNAAPVLAGLKEFLARVDLTKPSSVRPTNNAVQILLMAGLDDDAVAAMTSIRTEIEKAGSLPLLIDVMTQHANYLEHLGRLKEAETLYSGIGQKADQINDDDAEEQIALMLENAKKRLGLVGTEITVENMIDLEGEPIDWSKYQGKVVLLDFWATWCEPCIREFRNIYLVHEAYHEHGFEVIGVNIDDEMEPVQDFLKQVKLPWTIAFPDDPEKRGFSNPLAQKAGVEMIPFLMLVNQEGKVAAIHTRGARLESEVRRLLKIGDEIEPVLGAQAPAEKPKADPGADAAPEENKPAPESAPGEPELDLPLQPANEARPNDAPQTNGAASAPSRPQEFFVVFEEDAPEGASDAAAEEEKTSAPPARNVYLAEKGLSTFELVQYLQDMEDKPRVIQQRPGFAEAVAEAADRILAAPDAKDKYQVLAALAKFTFLHDRASFGDDKADAALAAFVEKMKDDPREKIAAEIKMLQLERRALAADQLDAAENEKLLADLKTYFQEHREELGEKHLRMASACVAGINKIEDGDAREKHFGEFGSLFASSSNKELARYGKRLSKTPSVSALVGQTLELDGLTELGTPFDWQAYRGKIVVVDFWATWCGPCRKAIPGLKAFHEANRDAGFDVVGVNLDEDAESLAEFLDQQRLPWSNLVGEDAARIADKYSMGVLPSFVLVDREGKVVEVSHSVEALQPKIEKLLKAS